MSRAGICPSPTLKQADRLHGFTVIRVQAIPDIRVTAYELTHDRTGAHVLHLHNDDRENLFSIGFRTPPKDSTGVAHILEHSVLAGSKKYPVKDAFNELAKGSLKTFLNAFTYPDKTVYPVASQVKVDFYHLARVYTDLVLHPLLLPQTFLQEGHHLEPVNFDDPASDLTISGIVYNEMKGMYSSPDALMFKILLEGLYPDMAYGFDAGGDPEVIPKLDYEDFKAFHTTYYSPSNAWFFLYGDIPTTEHLAFLEEMLKDFKQVDIHSEMHDQPRWIKIRRLQHFYPIGKHEALEKKTIVNLGWVTADNLDPEEVLLLQIAAIALVGTAGAPLRKALIDSQLGEDLSPATGLERDLKQVPFMVGLRGSDPDKADQIEKLIFDTLGQVVRQGFDPQLIEGALHQVEFHGKEISRTVMPYSITLLGWVYQTWLYGGDPLAGLQFSTLIESIRRRWQEQPSLFQQVVQRWLLDNKHCLRVVMEPSRTYQEEREEAFHRQMMAKKASLSQSQREEIRQEAMRLREEQIASDSPEALTSLPRLEIEDLPRETEIIPTRLTSLAGVSALEHEIFANGVVYLDLAFDISDIPDSLHPLLPLLGKLTLGMGAAGKSYELMSSLIALKMGGLSCSLEAGCTVDTQQDWQKLIIRMKVLHRNIPEAVHLLDELLTQADLSDRQRRRDLISEAKNQMISSVVPSGHAFARRTAASGLSLVSHREEQWHGLRQLRFLAHLADHFEQRDQEFIEKVLSLGKKIFSQSRLVINLTGDAEGLAGLTEALVPFLNHLPVEGKLSEPVQPSLTPLNYGIVIPAQVCYVAQVLESPTYLMAEAPVLSVLSHQLSSGLLYKRIRVQGGAYGGFSSYDPLNGQFAFLSYRDPNLEETLRVYQEAIEEMASREIESEELRKAVISTISALDKPMGPGSKGYTAMMRHFLNLSDEQRQQFRERVLEISASSLRKAAIEVLKPSFDRAQRAIYAAEDRLKKANEGLEPKLVIQHLVEEEK